MVESKAGHGVPPGKAQMERHVRMVCLGVAAVLAGAVALATGMGEVKPPEEEPVERRFPCTVNAKSRPTLGRFAPKKTNASTF